MWVWREELVFVTEFGRGDDDDLALGVGLGLLLLLSEICIDG